MNRSTPELHFNTAVFQKTYFSVLRVCVCVDEWPKHIGNRYIVGERIN